MGKSAVTINRIFDVAQTLFVEKHYADVSMTEIADAAAVTKGALYHHFASKEALYVAMMLADLETKQALLGQAVSLDGSCRARLHHLTVTYLNLPPTKRELLRLVRRDVNIFKNPSRRQLVRAYQKALPKQVEKIIKDGIKQGELADTDPRLLSWQFVGMVEILLSNYAQTVLGDSNQLASYVLDLFLNGAIRAKIAQ
ncbi:MAG: TetR/AcrR family transcriptional regulator [Chloroflexota bacterium]